MRNVMRNAVRCLLLILVLLLPALPLAASGGGERAGGGDGSGNPSRIFRRTVFMVSADSASGFSGQELRFLSDSLFGALVPLELVLIDARDVPAVVTGRPDPGLPAHRAAADRADAWIAVHVSRRDGDLVAALRVQDAVGNVPLADREFIRERWILRRLERERWEDLSAAVAEVLPPITNASTLTFRGLPGTRIDGIDFSGGLITPDGTLELRLASPETYSYRASLRGYYPVRGEVFLSEGGSEHEISLPRGSRWSAEAYLSNLSSPGIGAMYFIEPNYFFIRAGLTTHLISMYFDDGRDEYREPLDFFQSIPVTRFSAQVGSYLRAEDAFLRPYLALGPFLRFVHTDAFTGADPIAPGGLQLSAGLDLSMNPRLRFFLEWAPLYYRADGELFRAEFSEGTDPDNGYAWLGDVVVHYGNIRIGGRYHF